MKAKNDAKNRIPSTSLESRGRAIDPVVRRKHGTLIFVCPVKEGVLVLGVSHWQSAVGGRPPHWH